MCISPQRAAVFALLAVLAAGCGGAGSSPAPGRTQTALGDRPPMAVTEVPRRPAFIDTVPAPPPAARVQGRGVVVNATHPSFFNGEVALSNGVYYLQLPNGNIFGYYSYIPSDNHYIYHFDAGYFYAIDAGDANGGVYLYDFSSSHWWYTSRTFAFPYLYDFSLGALLYYYPASSAGHYTSNPRYFFDFGTNAIVTLPAAAAPTVGYLGSTGGGFSGALNGTTTSPLVVAISDAHVTGGPSVTIGTGSVVVNNGVGITAVRRTPQAVSPGRAEPPPDGPLETPQEYARLRSMLRRAPPGAAPSALRRTRSLGTTVGSTNSFWVNAFAIGTNGSTYQPESATLQVVTTHGYIWVADSLGLSGSVDAAIGNDFENAWSSDTTHFGTPLYTAAAPGEAAGPYGACDAAGNALTGVTVPAIILPVDPKIVVLVVDPASLGSGVGGYFDSSQYTPQAAWNCLIGRGTYTAANIPHSNEAPMFFDGYFATHTASFETGEDFVRGTAHEFQHLINFVNHDVLHTNMTGEDSWINEGMSMLAQDLAVHQMYPNVSNDVDDAVSRAKSYLAATETISVTGFTSVNSSNVQSYNCATCYGAEFLFQRYMYDRFGGDTYLHNMLSSSNVSYANLQAATGVDPTQALSDFALALAASNTGTTSDPRYIFTGLNLHSTLVDQFGNYLTLTGPTPLTLGTATYNDLLGTFLYLQGTAGMQGQTVTVKSPNANFVLNAAIVQK